MKTPSDVDALLLFSSSDKDCISVWLMKTLSDVDALLLFTV